MNVEIHETDNGYIVKSSGTVKKNGIYVFRSDEIIKMLEFVGAVVLDKKVHVKEA